MSFQLTTSGFQKEGMIPDKYAKDGGNISPPLSWTDVPEGARSLVLVMDDPDAPAGLFTHWIVYGIPQDATSLTEDTPATATLGHGIRQGRNSFGELGYGGPQPPSGVHRYFFHLFALDTELALPPGASRAEVDRAMEGHALAEARLMGLYQHREPGSQAA
jgi:Raf kinase inhibitor-like YbhB/YbcL family protein